MKTLTNLNGESMESRKGIGYYLLTFLVVEILFIALLLLSHYSFANGPGANDEDNTLLSFKVVYTGGKAYTKWYVQHEDGDGIFLVERSEDNKKFSVIGHKEGVGVPTDLIIMYSYIDKEPKAGRAWYRIHKVNEDGTQYYSEPYQVEVPATTPDLVLAK